MTIPEHEAIIVESKLDIRYSYHVGPVAARFYEVLEREKRILGIRCGSCGKVYMPPRALCGACFVKMTEWVELKDEGIVTNYTIVHYDEPIRPVKAPFAYALIRLDGADTPFIHILGETDLSRVRTGMRVKAVFADEMPGTILDIHYFKPIDPEP
jgi:uncharacterized OB-fold protein